MRKNRKIFLTILLSGFVLCLFSQNHNPFEINTKRENSHVAAVKTGTAKNDTIIAKKVEKEILPDNGNPFEIASGKIHKKNSGIKHENKTKSETIREKRNRKEESESFLLWLFLFLLVLVAILLTINRYLIAKIIKAIWYHNYANILYRTFFNRDLILYASLAVVFVLNFSVFIYLLSRKFFGIKGFDIYMYILAGVLLIYAVKHTAIYMMVKIFPRLKNLILYNFTVLIFSIAIGILLLPLNLIIAYSYDSISVFVMYFTMVILAFL